MRKVRKRIAIVVGVVSFLLQSGPASRAGWVVQEIADTSTAIPGGSGNFTSFGLVSLDNGRVAFQGYGTGSNQGIYSSTSGGAIQKVADNQAGSGFADFKSPTVSNNGTISFIADRTSGGSGVFVASSGNVTSVAVTGGSFSTIGLLDYFAPTSNGTTVFGAFYMGGGGQSGFGVYSSTGGVTSSIADATTGLPLGNGTQNFLFLMRPMIDAQGNVVFQATDGSGGASNSGIYAMINGNLVRIIDGTETLPGSTANFTPEGTAFRGPIISDGRVAFFSLGNGYDASSGVGYYGRDTDGSLTKLVTFADHPPGTNQTFVGLGGLSLAPSGAYVFAGYSQGQGGLYYSDHFGDGSVTQIVSGDTLFGKTIFDINVTPYALSGNEVAFSVRFQDGSSGLYLAVNSATASVPEPGTIVLTGLGLSCALLLRRQRGRRAERSR